MVTAIASISLTAKKSADYYEAELRAQAERAETIQRAWTAERKAAAYEAAHPIVKYLPARRGRKWVVEQWMTHPSFGFVIVGIFNTETAAKLYAEQLSNPEPTLPE